MWWCGHPLNQTNSPSTRALPHGRLCDVWNVKTTRRQQLPQHRIRYRRNHHGDPGGTDQRFSGTAVVVGVVPDDQPPHPRQRVGRVPLRTDVRSRARGGVRPGPGSLVSNLSRVISAVGDRADADPVADLVDLSAPLDRDLHPARPHRETGRTNPRASPAVSHHRRHQRRRRGANSDWSIGGRLAEQIRCPGRSTARPPGHNPLHPARRN